MKAQILAEIKKHLESIDNEIVGYGFSLNITTKKDKEEYLNDFITISKIIATDIFVHHIQGQQEYN